MDGPRALFRDFFSADGPADFWPFQAFVKIIRRHVQYLGKFQKPPQQNLAQAVFVFLYLLERYTHSVAKRLLAHTKKRTLQPQALANMNIDRVWIFRHIQRARE